MTDTMRATMTSLVAASLLALAPAAGAAPLFFPRWHVVQPQDSNTCYRMTVLPAGEGWRDLGTFDTFRQAGLWEWGHRDACRTMN
jgi:hypothetical protein